MSFRCLQIDQKTNKIFVWISALVSNMRSNQNLLLTFDHNIPNVESYLCQIDSCFHQLTQNMMTDFPGISMNTQYKSSLFELRHFNFCFAPLCILTCAAAPSKYLVVVTIDQQLVKIFYEVVFSWV